KTRTGSCSIRTSSRNLLSKKKFMKKRRGKVLKRFRRSSYYCDSRNSDRGNSMKAEEHLEPTAVFIRRVIAAVFELKDHLRQDYERTYPDLREIRYDEQLTAQTHLWHAACTESCINLWIYAFSHLSA